MVHGVSAEMVTGDTPKEERDEIIRRHKSGETRCVVNVAVLTTGYDNPRIDMIGILRPTESAGLHIQILGRGMRKAEGKTDALVLDYAGNCMRFGPIDKIDPDRKPGKGDGIPPSKCCPVCDYILPAATMQCPACGYEFPVPEKNIEHVASDAPVLSTDIVPVERKVNKTWFSVHSKPGKDACVKIEYECGLGEYYYDWVFPKSKFRSGYLKECKAFGVLACEDAHAWVSIANGRKIEGPHTIWTIPDGKYTKVVRKEFYKDTLPDFMHWRPDDEARGSEATDRAM
jgi:DNA repair protein RadD